MAVYQVRLVNPALNLDRTIKVPDDQYILDMADEAGIRLPSGCLQGECSACLAKIVSGKVDQSEQKFLKPSEIEAGYTVTCVAYPLSDCILETHQEQVLYQSSLYFSKDTPNLTSPPFENGGF
ncbi:MAG: 2Fe-2S iron-sulfur cluster-binding protein [Xenococcaceae cyanobacterium]